MVNLIYCASRAMCSELPSLKWCHCEFAKPEFAESARSFGVDHFLILSVVRLVTELKFSDSDDIIACKRSFLCAFFNLQEINRPRCYSEGRRGPWGSQVRHRQQSPHMATRSVTRSLTTQNRLSPVSFVVGSSGVAPSLPNLPFAVDPLYRAQY